MPTSYSVGGYKPRKIIVIAAHGARLPFPLLLNPSPDELNKRGKQWFSAGPYTSVYFPTDVLSEVPGGASIRTTCFDEEPTAAVNKLCNNFDSLTKEGDKMRVLLAEYDDLLVDTGFAEVPLYIKQDSPKGRVAAFSTTLASAHPLYRNKKCIPNMILSGENPPNPRHGIFACTEDDILTSEFDDVKPSGDRIKEITRTTLDDAVKFCEERFPDHDLHIFVLACAVSTDRNVFGGPTPFIRPAKSTALYKPGVLTPLEKECDQWAESWLKSSPHDAVSQSKASMGGRRRKAKRSRRRSSKRPRRTRRKR